MEIKVRTTNPEKVEINFGTGWLPTTREAIRELMNTGRSYVVPEQERKGKDDIGERWTAENIIFWNPEE